MSIEVLNRLKRERGELVTEMHSLIENAEAETEAGKRETPGMTSDENDKYQRMSAGLENLDTRIQRTEESTSRLADLKAQADHVNRNLPGRGDVSSEQREQRGVPGERENREHSDAFDSFVRYGYGELVTEERAAMKRGIMVPHRVKGGAIELRAQSVGTDDKGGFTVPEEWNNAIVTAMLQFGGLRNVANVMQTATGQPIHYPGQTDVANKGVLLAENNEETTKTDLTFNGPILTAYKFSSDIVLVSEELLQDSAFDLSAYTGAMLGERLGRGEADYIATGTGSSQPTGIEAAAASGKTAASATAVTYNEMLDLKHSVDPAYRTGARWVFNDSTLKALKQLQDSAGLPLWQPDIAGPAAATLDGDPYTIDQSVDSLATGLFPVYYGDFSKFIVRDAGPIRLKRLVERYAEWDQVGFIAFHRMDCNLIDGGGGAVKKLTMA